MHASPLSRNVHLSNFYLPSLLTLPPAPNPFSTYTVSRADLQSKIGHLVRHPKGLKQVPVSRACRIWIGSKTSIFVRHNWKPDFYSWFDNLFYLVHFQQTSLNTSWWTYRKMFLMRCKQVKCTHWDILTMEHIDSAQVAADCVVSRTVCQIFCSWFFTRVSPWCDPFAVDRVLNTKN